MSYLLELGADVEWPDDDAATELRTRFGGASGELRSIGGWLAAAQSSSVPRRPARVRLIRFGSEDVTAPQAVEAAAPFAGVRAIANVVSDPGSALRIGATTADDEIERGADLCIVSVAGSARSAAVLVSVLTDTEPVRVLPRGAAMSPEHWMAAAESIRDGRRDVVGFRGDLPALLGAAGTSELIAAVGFVLRAAARRTPMIVDGLAATAAALVAFEVQPRSARWWRPADSSAQPAARAALSRMGQTPILALDSDISDATGGVLAAHVIHTAAAVAAAASGGDAAAAASGGDAGAAASGGDAGAAASGGAAGAGASGGDAGAAASGGAAGAGASGGADRGASALTSGA